MNNLEAETRLSVHLGNIFFMVADTYPSIMDTVAEQVQNSLDADAKRVEVTVDVKKRTIVIRDDGAGVTKSELDKALSLVGLTQKGKGKLGRFGRGLVSPLDKCEGFTFTSRPRSGGQYRMWIFDPQKIKAQPADIFIPNTTRDDIYRAKQPVKARESQGQHCVWWNTEVAISSYTTDREISKVTGADLASLIAEKYRTTLLRTKAKVVVRFVSEDDTKEMVYRAEPSQFQGNPLPETEYWEKKGKKSALFRIYVLPRKLAKGKTKLFFGERDDEFRITWQQFAHCARDFLSSEAVEVLASGMLEGEILSESAKLDPGRGAKGRGSFVRDDGLIDFLAAVETWCLDVGKKHVEDAKSEAKEQEWQEIGIEALQRFEPLVSRFNATLAAIRQGNVGHGHAETGKKETEMDERALATRGRENPLGGRSGQSGSASGDSGERDTPPVERPGHIPLSVFGPRGSSRRRVRNNSVGLSIDFLPIGDSLDPCQVDVSTGTIVINTRHRHWSQCEGKRTTLLRYMEAIIPHALLLCEAEQHSDDHYLHVATALERSLECQVHNILVDSTRPKRKKV